ncbi:hypothetical protein BGZ60DRAFT_257070 [Tricladium varicosporioides]|nr:hypothetical protein BGZ60DRAFT_257070 [Hymenoscyphus varicosporioides]
MASNSRTGPVSAQCHLCEKSFSRQEHLNRHILTHTNEKPYGCTTCRKRFSRSDILSRHQAAHRSEDAAKKSRRTIGAGFRACLSCASARVKCSGSDPCNRCSSREIDCNYPPPARKKAKTRDHQQIVQLSTNDVESPLQAGQAIVSQKKGNTAPTQQGEGELSVQYSSYSTNAIVPNCSLENGADVPLMCQQSSYMSIDSFSYDAQYRIQGLNEPQTSVDNDPTNSYDFTLPLQANQTFQDVQFQDFYSTSINWLSPIDYGYDDFNFDDMNLQVYATQPITSSSNPPPSADVAINGFGNPYGEFVEGNGNTNHQNHSKSQVSESSHATPTDYVVSPRGSGSLSSGTSGARSTARYVDGAGARDTRYGKLKRKYVLQSHLGAREVDSMYQSTIGNISFPSELDTGVNRYNLEKVSEISPRIYEKLFLEFETHCINTIRPFAAPYFPSLNVFYLGITLYFENFHEVYNILHKSSILSCQDENAFVIFVAISAIGIKYLGTSDGNKCSEAWLELLSRLVEHQALNSISSETNVFSSREASQLTPVDLYQLQAQILGVLGMFNSCNESLVQRAYDWQAKLVQRCLKMQLLQDDNQRLLAAEISQLSWQQWISREGRRRLGYSIWLIDTTIAYQSSYRPQLLLTDAKASLPCHEDLWEISDNNVWREAQVKYHNCLSLLGALEAIYKNKIVDRNLGELARTILIHGLYRRTWEVANYHMNTLSSWVPSAPGTRPNSRAGTEEPEDWLPGIPSFAKWRNSACDCLDILHWEANSTVAQKVGLEHPLILHLHLARLILLTPATTIQSFAAVVIQHSKTTDSLVVESLTSQFQDYRKEIIRWFLRDQYKARLSLVHAGAIFWHVRRYSHDNMLEPFAVLLSTLVIWAYATSSQAVNQQARQASEVDGAATRNQIDIRGLVVDSNGTVDQDVNSATEDFLIDSPYINLDRLCDDELIQTFVRHGTKMTGHMAGIGDICQVGSAGKILREGVKILLNSGTNCQSAQVSNPSELPIPTWRMAAKHAIFLEELANLRDAR